MPDFPIVIADQEAVVRCVVSPYHYDGKRLNWRAFQPPRNRDGVSVIRGDYSGASFCKRHGKSLATDQKRYEGLAVLSAAAVRMSGADIQDSRNVYLYHADILHGHIPIDGEPAPPEVMLKVKDRCIEMLNRSRFMKDPEPSSDEWTGELLTPPDRVTA